MNAEGGIVVGDHVAIGPNVVIYSQNHRYTGSGPVLQQGYDHAAVRIEDHVWIGAGAIVLPGVTIGRGSVIGAGAVVTKDVPAGVLAAGNPARTLRALDRAV